LTTYLLVDSMNLFFRCKHIAGKQAELDQKLGMAIHLTFSSMLKIWRKFPSDHVVFCMEGKSWRKAYYEPYKKNRIVARAAKTEKEVEEDEMFFEVYNEMVKFLREKTNVTVLHNENVEADDLIARWTQNHPDDHHIILSNDSDFVQLISENVHQYVGIQNYLITPQGYFDDKGKRVQVKAKKLDSNGKICKTHNGKHVMIEVDRPAPDPEYALFEKCMRGDTADNIFSAYPGVRTKGSQKKAGLEEAFADKKGKGYEWNNMMLQRWTDHTGTEHRVVDDYNRNVTLVDLTQQPDDIIESLDETIANARVEQKDNRQVGWWFLKFCGKHNLPRLSDNADHIAKILTAGY